MKLTIKILKLLSVLIITVSILLFSASYLLQDKVADIILKSLNKNISTKLAVGSFRLSFLKKFPKASLELKDVLVLSSGNFNSDLFMGINTDTLLAARIMSVEFKISDIHKGIYNIANIGARDGKINFYTDTAGLVNYDISSKSEDGVNDNFTIDLEKIELTDIKACYYNLATKLSINGYIKTGRLKSRISGKDIDFTAKADLQIDSFQLYNTRIIKTINTDIDVSLQSSKSGIVFKKGTIEIENYDFGIDGAVSADKMVNLNVTGNNLDLSKIRNYLPEKYLYLVSEYDPSGILIVDCKINGYITRTSNPHIEIKTTLSNGHIAYGKSDLAIHDLSFAGYFSNGSKNRSETSSILINELKAKLGSAEYSGSFSLSGFNNPRAELFVKGKVFPEELKEFFALKKISTARGSFDMDLSLAGNLKHEGRYTFSDIIDMKPEASIGFNSFSIGLNNDNFLLDQVNGTLLVSNSIRTNNLSLIYAGQRIKINGEFKNLIEWLIGKPVKMIATGDVIFSRLIPEAFLKNSPSSGSSSLNKTVFALPDDMLLDINFWIDSLNYRSISASKIQGTLNYKPKLLTFTSLNMNSLDGNISGNGFIVQNINKSTIARANLNVINIDVNRAFKTFNNFGQDFLKAENITGKLSGSLSFLLPMDSLLIPQIKSITAEGKYILTNGMLKNFEPVKQLSNFIELSELENISFEKLENDFFIKNNLLYIPQMDVKSSAVDLSVNGQHSFNNDYEYHIKMLLSVILSKKRKKNKINVSEFGTIQDDGLGRTSILLKIENKGDDIKVGYDMKAVGSEIKNNIKSERQSLKTILNQEYGWFKNDSATKPKPSEKPRFRISWEEADSVKNNP